MAREGEDGLFLSDGSDDGGWWQSRGCVRSECGESASQGLIDPSHCGRCHPRKLVMARHGIFASSGISVGVQGA